MPKLNQKSNKVNNLEFNSVLLNWYDKKARILPWRIPPTATVKGYKNDPYHVWVSEIMLQQTGVKTVQKYYLNFIKKWPNIFKLNEANENDILKEWSGLGYYKRARNLKACAKIICNNYNGTFPDEEKLLLKLPGIGSYTAAAILAIAFNKPSIVIDGNIERIIARLFEITDIINKSKPLIITKMKEISSIKRPGDFAQSMMDLGATICKPLNPKCENCPVINFCLAYKNKTYNLIPKKMKRKTIKCRKGYVYIAINNSNKIMLVKRPNNGLLGGTICPPSSEWKEADFPKIIPPFKGSWEMLNQSIFHSFTHFELELKIMISFIKHVPDKVHLEIIDHDMLNSLPTVMKKAVMVGLKKYFN